MTGWTQPERGGGWPARLMLWLTLRLGRQVGRVLLPPITLFFFLTAPAARAASRDYLGRVLARPARAADVLRHFHSFASATLDRVVLLSDPAHAIEIDIAGLEQLPTAGGCILLGAHVGSFEALRAVARRSPVAVRMLMFRRNAGAPTRLLERLNPQMAARVIEIGSPEAMLQVHESLASGELVGILGDRTPAGERCLPVRFLGSDAAFPAGPLIIAAVLQVPVVLFHAVRSGPRCYKVTFEAFADKVILRRASRNQDLQTWLERYAACVETWCRADPFQWFNFYPFWEPLAHAASAFPGDPVRRSAAPCASPGG